MHSRAMLAAMFLLGLATSVILYAAPVAQEITVYKLNSCGCCAKWVEHLKASGFQVAVQEVDDPAEYAQKNGVPEELTSCHTAVVDGYTIEGHVPAADIQRLLKERPAKAKGLAVAGMPTGAPGMEGAHSDAYSVILFDEDGHTSVYHKYPAQAADSGTKL
jgi:hypothetical protein